MAFLQLLHTQEIGLSHPSIFIATAIRKGEDWNNCSHSSKIFTLLPVSMLSFCLCHVSLCSTRQWTLVLLSSLKLNWSGDALGTITAEKKTKSSPACCHSFERQAVSSGKQMNIMGPSGRIKLMGWVMYSEYKYEMVKRKSKSWTERLPLRILKVCLSYFLWRKVISGSKSISSHCGMRYPYKISELRVKCVFKTTPWRCSFSEK